MNFEKKPEANISVEPPRVAVKKGRSSRWEPHLKELILTLLAILFIVAVMTLIFWPSLSNPGIPSGVDTPSFLHTSQFVVDYLVEHHAIPPTDPHWYSGLEHLHYAPPLIYIPIGLFYYLTGSIRLGGKLFQIVMMSLAALSMFLVVKKRYNVYSATVAALLFPLAPWTFFQLGSPTKLLAAVFLPICFHFTEKVLIEKENLPLVFLAIFFLTSLLSHPMMGLIYMAGMTVYAVVYASLTKDVPFGRSFRIVLAAALSATLGGFYVIPYYLEKAGWTAVPQQELINYSHPLDRSLLYTGIPLIILGLYAAFGKKEPRRIGLLTIAIIGWFLSLGIFGAGFIYEYVFPFLKLTYPGLWLNLPIFAFAYLSAIAVDFKKITGTGSELERAIIAILIICVGLFAADKVDNFTQLKNAQSQLADKIICAKLNLLENDGRVLPMKYPFGYLIWELSNRTDKHILEGHYFGLARINKYISWNYDAIDNGYINYPLNMLHHHNVKYVVVNGNLLESRGNHGVEFVAGLEKAGFKKQFKVPSYYGDVYSFYQNKANNSYLIPVEERTLVIGKYAYIPAAILSDQNGKVMLGGSPYLDDYYEGVLSQFETLILYGFSYHNRAKAEKLVKNFIKQGGQVVLDLYGAGPYRLEEEPTFLGVTGYKRIAKGPFEIEFNSELAQRYFAYENFDLPRELSFSGQVDKQLKEWRYVVYAGIDEPLAHQKGEENDNTFFLSGFKRVEGGKVLFLGPNLFYHVYLTHNEEAIKKLAKALLNPQDKLAKADRAKGLDDGLYQENPEINSQSVEPAKLEFKYKSSDDFPALVSYVYSPHWKAYLDGKPVKVSNLEDLMLVILPAGEHSLKLLYEDTPVHNVARGVSLFTLLLFGGLFYQDKKRSKVRKVG